MSVRLTIALLSLIPWTVIVLAAVEQILRWLRRRQFRVCLVERSFPVSGSVSGRSAGPELERVSFPKSAADSSAPSLLPTLSPAQTGCLVPAPSPTTAGTVTDEAEVHP